MRELVVNEKTGFQIVDPYTPVVIRDQRGLLFLSTETLTPKIKKFNLPGIGKLFIESGKFIDMPTPVNYKLVRLPKVSEHNYPVHPSEFDIEFGENKKDKCTINFAKHTIKFDNSYKEKPLPVIFYTLYHEWSHQYFVTEHLADQMACNYMLQKGFSPCQIKDIPRKTLSDKQEYRKLNIEARMKESNGLDC